jgi:hypothetical protein
VEARTIEQLSKYIEQHLERSFEQYQVKQMFEQPQRIPSKTDFMNGAKLVLVAMVQEWR